MLKDSESTSGCWLHISDTRVKKLALRLPAPEGKLHLILGTLPYDVPVVCGAYRSKLQAEAACARINEAQKNLPDCWTFSVDTVDTVNPLPMDESTFKTKVQA